MKKLIEVGMVLLASRSKCYQKVEELSKVWRVAKVIGLRKLLLKHRSSVNEELELLLKLWQFFELFLLGPKALLIPLSDWLSTKQSSPTNVLGSYFFFESNFSIPDFYLQNIHPLSATLILEIRSKRRCLSPRQRCLMTERMSRNSLPGNTMETCSCYRYLSTHLEWLVDGLWGGIAHIYRWKEY